MTKEKFAEAIAKIAAPQGDKGKLDCIPSGQSTLCTWGLYDGILSGDKVFSITYKIPLFEQPIYNFVKAFSQKYGKPSTQKRSYRSGLGIRFSGEAFVWQRGSQKLEVAETCYEIGEPCITMDDTKLMKKEVPPPI